VLVDAMQMSVHAAQQYPAVNLSRLAQAIEKATIKTRSTQQKFKKEN
jgi:uncharacterized membrane protein